MFRNSYLCRLFQYDPKIFTFVAVFSGLTLLCNVRGMEQTPFFVWGMYSQKEENPSSYTIHKIEINDSLTLDYSAGFTDATRYFLSSPLAYYDAARELNWVDPLAPFLQTKLKGKLPVTLTARLLNTNEDWRRFAPWYAKYIAQTIQIPVQALTLSQVVVHYSPQGKIVLDSVYRFERWQK